MTWDDPLHPQQVELVKADQQSHLITMSSVDVGVSSSATLHHSYGSSIEESSFNSQVMFPYPGITNMGMGNIPNTKISTCLHELGNYLYKMHSSQNKPVANGSSPAVTSMHPYTRACTHLARISTHYAPHLKLHWEKPRTTAILQAECFAIVIKLSPPAGLSLELEGLPAPQISQNNSKDPYKAVQSVHFAYNNGRKDALTPSNETLVDELNSGNFHILMEHIEGLNQVYNIPGDKALRCRAYLCLQSLERDVVQLSHVSRSSNQTSNSSPVEATTGSFFEFSAILTHLRRSPLGVALPRVGGQAARILYYATPRAFSFLNGSNSTQSATGPGNVATQQQLAQAAQQELLSVIHRWRVDDDERDTTENPSRSSFVQREVFWLNVALQSSCKDEVDASAPPLYNLHFVPLVTLQKENSGQCKAQFSRQTSDNVNSIPMSAVFVAQLDPVLLLCESLATELHEVTDLFSPNKANVLLLDALKEKSKHALWWRNQQQIVSCGSQGNRHSYHIHSELHCETVQQVAFITSEQVLPLVGILRRQAALNAALNTIFNQTPAYGSANHTDMVKVNIACTDVNTLHVSILYSPATDPIPAFVLRLDETGLTDCCPLLVSGQSHSSHMDIMMSRVKSVLLRTQSIPDFVDAVCAAFERNLVENSSNPSKEATERGSKLAVSSILQRQQRSASSMIDIQAPKLGFSIRSDFDLTPVTTPPMPVWLSRNASNSQTSSSRRITFPLTNEGGNLSGHHRMNTSNTLPSTSTTTPTSLSTMLGSPPGTQSTGKGMAGSVPALMAQKLMSSSRLDELLDTEMSLLAAAEGQSYGGSYSGGPGVALSQGTSPSVLSSLLNDENGSGSLSNLVTGNKIRKSPGAPPTSMYLPGCHATSTSSGAVSSLPPGVLHRNSSSSNMSRTTSTPTSHMVIPSTNTSSANMSGGGNNPRKRLASGVLDSSGDSNLSSQSPLTSKMKRTSSNMEESAANLFSMMNSNTLNTPALSTSVYDFDEPSSSTSSSIGALKSTGNVNTGGVGSGALPSSSAAMGAAAVGIAVARGQSPLKLKIRPVMAPSVSGGVLPGTGGPQLSSVTPPSSLDSLIASAAAGTSGDLVTAGLVSQPVKKPRKKRSSLGPFMTPEEAAAAGVNEYTTKRKKDGSFKKKPGRKPRTGMPGFPSVGMPGFGSSSSSGLGGTEGSECTLTALLSQMCDSSSVPSTPHTMPTATPTGGDLSASSIDNPAAFLPSSSISTTTTASTSSASSEIAPSNVAFDATTNSSTTATTSALDLDAFIKSAAFSEAAVAKSAAPAASAPGSAFPPGLPNLVKKRRERRTSPPGVKSGGSMKKSSSSTNLTSQHKKKSTNSASQMVNNPLLQIDLFASSSKVGGGNGGLGGSGGPSSLGGHGSNAMLPGTDSTGISKYKIPKKKSMEGLSTTGPLESGGNSVTPLPMELTTPQTAESSNERTVVPPKPPIAKVNRPHPHHHGISPNKAPTALSRSTPKAPSPLISNSNQSMATNMTPSSQALTSSSTSTSVPPTAAPPVLPSANLPPSLTTSQNANVPQFGAPLPFHAGFSNTTTSTSSTTSSVSSSLTNLASRKPLPNKSQPTSHTSTGTTVKKKSIDSIANALLAKKSTTTTTSSSSTSGTDSFTKSSLDPPPAPPAHLLGSGNPTAQEKKDNIFEKFGGNGSDANSSNTKGTGAVHALSPDKPPPPISHQEAHGDNKPSARSAPDYVVMRSLKDTPDSPPPLEVSQANVDFLSAHRPVPSIPTMGPSTAVLNVSQMSASAGEQKKSPVSGLAKGKTSPNRGSVGFAGPRTVGFSATATAAMPGSVGLRTTPHSGGGGSVGPTRGGPTTSGGPSTNSSGHRYGTSSYPTSGSVAHRGLTSSTGDSSSTITNSANTVGMVGNRKLGTVMGGSSTGKSPAMSATSGATTTMTTAGGNATSAGANMHFPGSEANGGRNSQAGSGSGGGFYRGRPPQPPWRYPGGSRGAY